MFGRGMFFTRSLVFVWAHFLTISVYRFFAQGAIKLEGDEKTLTADTEAAKTHGQPCKEKAEPAAFS